MILNPDAVPDASLTNFKYASFSTVCMGDEGDNAPHITGVSKGPV